MPLRLDIKRKLTSRSDRVKSVDLHPTEPWMLVSLYSGSVVVWNHETQMMVKMFEVCDLPVRVAKFVARKHWVIAGADNMQICVFNYNTLERVHAFEAHCDYIRCIAVHPTQPFILTSSDDMLIKLWDWERKWMCSQVFDGHTHYVMHIVINPKDNNQFASASLDRTIKVWQLGSKTPNFTLEGHEKGVNCIDYYSGGDKPYLISGADDHLVKIWDYQNKTCVQTLQGHAQNVTCVSFHPELPILLTGSEDGTVRVWHSNTYRLENTLNYGMERVWCICGQTGSNSVALGYDEGSIIIKLGRDEPAMSMDSSGKVMWARHSEVQLAHLKTMGDAEIKDGEKLLLGVKDMGSCEIYPQTMQHSPNGRFVVVCGDGEYIIYTAMALRNKSFGSAQEFVWAHDSSQYAIREGNHVVKIFKSFKEKKTFKPDFGAEGIFGGFLLGVRSNSGLAFFDWEETKLIRRIEIQPKHIFWSDSGELVCIATDESFFVLRYRPERVAAAQESKEDMMEDGIEDAFEVLREVQDVVKTGVWVGDCFIYTNSVNRLNYFVGGEIIVISHMDRTMYLLGYIPKDDRVYLGDKELNVISFSLLLSVLEYQTAVMRRDFSTADKVLPTIPKAQRTRVANFLEKQGFRQQALAVSTDPEHRFELAVQLGELKTAYQLALEAESEHKWKQLAELATTKGQFNLAQECLHHAQDYGALLLLATSSGNAAMVGKLAEGAEKDDKTNVAFLTYFLQGKLEKCLELLIKTDRLPEAAFLARTYLPSHVSRVVKLWKEGLSKVNRKAADALADPTQYANLFPGLQENLLAEQYLKESDVRVRPAAEYPLIVANEDRRVLDESAGFVPKGGIAEPEEVAGEAVIVAAVTDAAPVEAAAAAVVEEPNPQEQECTDALSTTEESVTTAAFHQSITKTEHVDPKPAQSSSVVDASESVVEVETVVSVKDEGLQKPIIDIPPKEPEMVQSRPVEDIRSAVNDTVPANCGPETSSTETKSETIMATKEGRSEAEATTTVATKDSQTLVTTVITSEEPCSDSIAAEAPGAEEAPGAAEAPVAAEATATVATEDSRIVNTNVLESEELSSDIIAAEAPGETDATATLAAEDSQTVGPTVLASEQPSPDIIATEAPGEAETTEKLAVDTNVMASEEPCSDIIAREAEGEAVATDFVASKDSQIVDINVMASKELSSDIIVAELPGDTKATEKVEVDTDVMASEETGSDIIAAEAEGEAVATDFVATEDSQIVDINVMASKETEGVPADEELDTDIISSEVPSIIATAAAAAVNKEQDIATSPVPVDELISFEDRDTPSLDVLVPVQTFSDSAFNLLLDPLSDAMPVLKPVITQDPEQTSALAVNPEVCLEPAVPLQAKPEVLSPAAAPAEGDVAEGGVTEGVEEPAEQPAEEPAEDLEAEMNDFLGDLDLDNFDLENIDTTDVNLEEDLLNY